jgi:DNA mismatch repair ATPase MutS
LKSTSSQILFLDSQVLANLEINEIGYTSKNFQNLTLFDFMNKTSSSYGKRKFEKWMLEPLFDTVRINERLDAVEDLMQKSDLCDYFQKELGKIPDIERKIARIYNFANKKRLSADYFEIDYLGNRLKEFAGLINDLKKVNELMETFEEYVNNFKSKRLRQLITFYDIKNKKKSGNLKGLLILILL